DTEADLYVAIDRATDRARRTAMRRIERQQSLLRQPAPEPELSA
ncbi:MAG TPA: HPF/RaiA family ribosome-associated protein, partial [Thiolapillus brandeum]|nr:HPF/RaiA family ribosome-associated protein [Thiolapillus brandeum]